MDSVISALVAALRTLFHPKMLALVLWPMLAAAVLWVGAALYFWADWVASLNEAVQASPLEEWVAHGFLAVAAHYLISVILVMLLLPAIYVTALVLTAVFAMPSMVKHVAAKHYPELERKQGGSTAGSLWNSAVAVAVYLTGWVLSLPLWLISPFAMALPIVFTAYLNQRLFRYDSLAEHASGEEYRRIVERSLPKFYLLGAALGLLQFVPLLNLFSPVYAGLAFIHLCLSELQQLRREECQAIPAEIN